MQTWMYGLIAIPVVALGAAYGMGAFSTNVAGINQNIKELEAKKTAFMGDDESYQSTAGSRRKRTKKSKSANKKTKRR